MHGIPMLSQLVMLLAGLHQGQTTAQPKPVFARLEGDFVTSSPDAAKAQSIKV